MTNREYMAKQLSDPDWIDNGGSSYEAMVYYNIDCPYFPGDKRKHCGEGKEPNRNRCSECKLEWLEAVVDEYLGIPVRVLDFNRKGEMLDYVSGLRMTDTPYAIQDVTNRSNPKTIDLMTTDEVGRDKMAQMLKDWAERKEE